MFSLKYCSILLLLLLIKFLASNCGYSCGPPHVVCYFTNWGWQRKDIGKFLPANINVSLCTHVLYAFAKLDEKTLTIDITDKYADLDNHFYELVTALKSLGIVVLLSMGGWQESCGSKYSLLVNNITARTNFITHSITFLHNYGFQGLDCDWEYPKCWQGKCSSGPDSEKHNFGLFIKEMKTAYEKQNLLLSLAVAAHQRIIDFAYDVPTISHYADFINVMTYDLHLATNNLTGANSPFSSYGRSPSVIKSMEYFVQKGADPCKLMMGIPMYARTFTLADPENHTFGSPYTGSGLAGNYTNEAGFLAFYEICLKMKYDGWYVKHTIEKSSYTFKGDQFASYCGPLDIYFRTYLIRNTSYGGAMIWSLDLDDFGNTCECGKYPLLTAINIGLGRIQSLTPFQNRLCYEINF